MPDESNYSGASIIEREMAPETAKLDVYSGDDNIIGLMELQVGLEAIGDNIIVLLDSYKSGYECTTCKGTGKMQSDTRCICDPPEGTQLYKEQVIEGNVLPGTRNRHGALCESCEGNYLDKRKSSIVDCKACSGKGALLFIPKHQQALPTTGIILSVGPEVTRKGIEKNIRVVCGPHAGTGIPMMGYIPIKVYRQHEPLCRMYNMLPDGKAQKEEPGELTTSKFLEYDVPLGEQYKA
jgi:hypothetical protein